MRPTTERRHCVIADNLRRLSDRHPDTLLVFENHDGASLVPEICRDVLTSVDRPNIRMNFDPINFARAGVDPAAALAVVRPLVAHVHLKGLERGEFCEFGAGDVNLAPILAELVRHGYGGDFTVEYRGPIRRDVTAVPERGTRQDSRCSSQLIVNSRRRPVETRGHRRCC